MAINLFGVQVDVGSPRRAARTSSGSRDAGELTADTITDAQIEEEIALLRAGRMSNLRRALLADCRAAMDGDKFCRGCVAERINARNAVIVTVPRHLVEAVRTYLATNWDDGRDPSRLGALNAVACIGEQFAACLAAVLNSR